MDLLNCKLLKSTLCHMNSTIFKCCLLLLFILAFRSLMLFSTHKNISWIPSYYPPNPSHLSIRVNKFLEVPQIIWGLNNQNIAFARACLTAKLLNRTLLMPILTSNLVYKEINSSEPIPFDKVFDFEKFNSRCRGFVQLGRYSDLSNRTDPIELNKGSGRRWSKERDLSQLRKFKEVGYENFEVIKILGKNPFLWHDHWPIKDHAKVLQCLVLVDEIGNDTAKVVSMIRSGENNVPYIAVHMRIEKDWKIHCKKVEQRFVYLGGYDSEQKAARTYDLAALKYWGVSATTNFLASCYCEEMEIMKNMTKQEFIASIRRNSSGFSRGASIYKGVTRRYFGNKNCGRDLTKK